MKYDIRLSRLTIQTVSVNALCFCSVLSKLRQQHCSEHCCLISTTRTTFIHGQSVMYCSAPYKVKSSENVRSLSLARKLGTHYRMTFAKSQTLIHLSAIQNFTCLIIIFTYRPRLWFYVKSVIRYRTVNIVTDVLTFNKY